MVGEVTAASPVILTPAMGPQAIPLNKDNFPSQIGAGILLGKATQSQKGIQIVPGLITTPASKFFLLASAQRGPIVINDGDTIAQFLWWPSPKDNRGQQGHLAALSMTLDHRPFYVLTIKGKQIRGLLDTGADVSVIANTDWPRKWPQQESEGNLVGLGIAVTPARSSAVLTWTDEEGHTGQFQPYVCDVPVTLWGRDVLTLLQVKLTNESNVAWNIMEKAGYRPGKGLGKYEQGITQPIPATGQMDRCGLGFPRGPL